MQALCRSKSREETLSRTFTQILATSPGIFSSILWFSPTRPGLLPDWLCGAASSSQRQTSSREDRRQTSAGRGSVELPLGTDRRHSTWETPSPAKESLHRAAPPRRLEPPGAAPIYHTALEWFKEVYHYQGYHRLLFHGCVFLNKLHYWILLLFLRYSVVFIFIKLISIIIFWQGLLLFLS